MVEVRNSFTSKGRLIGKFLLAPLVVLAMSTSTPLEIIKEQSASYKVDYELAAKVASCESKMDPEARNKTSTAKGLYQFLNGTWKHYGLKKWGSLEGKDVLDPEDNTELAMWVMATYGMKDWEASRFCWKVAYPPKTELALERVLGPNFEPLTMYRSYQVSSTPSLSWKASTPLAVFGP